MIMASFKIHGFPVYQRGNKVWYIKFSRTQKRSLKTTDKKQAKAIAEIAVEKYFQKKIVSIKKDQRKLISEYFLEYSRSRETLALSTIQMDKTAMAMFLDVIGDKSIVDVTTKDFETFSRIHLQRGNKKKAVTRTTINSYLTHLKVFFRQAGKDGIIQTVPDIKKLKAETRLPVILTTDEKENLFQYCKEHDPEFGRIIRFALFTGCRRSEILSARWENFYGFTIKVFGKGLKERMVPLVPQAKKAMGTPKRTGPIFFQCHPDTYTHRFKKYARACGIHGKSFHKMRHSAATSMLEAGIDINVIQQILGHTDIATTKIYAKVMEKFMVSEMKKFGSL